MGLVRKVTTSGVLSRFAITAISGRVIWGLKDPAFSLAKNTTAT